MMEKKLVKSFLKPMVILLCVQFIFTENLLSKNVEEVTAEVTEAFIKSLYGMNDAYLTDIVARINKAIIASQPPSMFSLIAEKIGDMLRDASNSAEIVYRSARSDGLSSAEAHKKALEAFTKGISIGFSVLGNGFKSFYQSAGFDINAFQKIAQWATFVIVSAYAAKHGFEFLKEYYILRMNTPKLVRSVLTPDLITKKLDDLVYTGKTHKEIARIIKTAQGVVNNKKTGCFYKWNPWRDTSKGRAKFENVMLWGPPGTGKTAIVEVIAKEAGMNLFVTSGGDFAKLRGKDLQQIDELFDQARNSSRPTLLFIDEMEDLFGSRSRGNVSEESRQIFSKLLTEFSAPSNQIMLIGATNRPQDLDEAMYRRMPVQVEVAYPDKNGRIKIYRVYKRLLFDDDAMYNKTQHNEIDNVFSDSAIANIEEVMGEISPAEIANIMGSIKNRSLTDNYGVPTQAIIDEVIEEKMGHLKAIGRGFVRSNNSVYNNVTSTTKDVNGENNNKCSNVGGTGLSPVPIPNEFIEMLSDQAKDVGGENNNKYINTQAISSLPFATNEFIEMLSDQAKDVGGENNNKYMNTEAISSLPFAPNEFIEMLPD